MTFACNSGFLTAALNGKAIYVGDTVYSNYHKKYVQAKGIMIDCDGDVYINFDGGNAKLSSIIRYVGDEPFEALKDLEFSVPAREWSVDDNRT